jgi:hypothetical protein
MNSEMDILLELHAIIIHNIEQSKSNYSKISNLKSKIDNFDNDYFKIKCKETLFNDFIQLFTDEEKYDEIISNLSSLKDLVEGKIKSTCVNHYWIEDLIDITPDNSQYIKYCEYCHVTQHN